MKELCTCNIYHDPNDIYCWKCGKRMADTVLDYIWQNDPDIPFLTYKINKIITYLKEKEDGRS